VVRFPLQGFGVALTGSARLTDPLFHLSQPPERFGARSMEIVQRHLQVCIGALIISRGEKGFPQLRPQRWLRREPVDRWTQGANGIRGATCPEIRSPQVCSGRRRVRMLGSVLLQPG
jgi:hypothetical protein